LPLQGDRKSRRYQRVAVCNENLYFRCLGHCECPFGTRVACLQYPNGVRRRCQESELKLQL
jgi:hypothetical protein